MSRLSQTRVVHGNPQRLPCAHVLTAGGVHLRVLEHFRNMVRSAMLPHAEFLTDMFLVEDGSEGGITVTFLAALDILRDGRANMCETRRVKSYAGCPGAQAILAFEAGRLSALLGPNDRIIVFTDNDVLRNELEPLGLRFIMPVVYEAHENWWALREKGLLHPVREDDGPALEPPEQEGGMGADPTPTPEVPAPAPPPTEVLPSEAAPVPALAPTPDAVPASVPPPAPPPTEVTPPLPPPEAASIPPPVLAPPEVTPPEAASIPPPPPPPTDIPPVPPPEVASIPPPTEGSPSGPPPEEVAASVTPPPATAPPPTPTAADIPPPPVDKPLLDFPSPPPVATPAIVLNSQPPPSIIDAPVIMPAQYTDLPPVPRPQERSAAAAEARALAAAVLKADQETRDADEMRASEIAFRQRMRGILGL